MADNGKPLVHVADTSPKSRTKDIYVNAAGMAVIIRLAEHLVRTGDSEAAAMVHENGEDMPLNMHLVTQDDFDCGGPK